MTQWTAASQPLQGQALTVKYSAEDGEDVSREEFERRWRAGETIIK